MIGFWEKVKTNELVANWEGMTMFELEGFIYVFGGYNGEILNDLFKLEDLRWFIKQGNVDIPIFEGRAINVWNSSLVIFGGGTIVNAGGEDLWILSLETNIYDVIEKSMKIIPQVPNIKGT